MIESIETVIVGGGQAGLSLSYYLQQQGREHIVLEKASQPANAWRNERWDSFTLVSPNWSFRLPGAEYHDDEPSGFMPRHEIVQRFEQYVERHNMPVRYNTGVESVTQAENGYQYHVIADGVTCQARNVVIATGLFQRAKIPGFAAEIPSDIMQLHSGEYRNPHSLPPGAVLVVGTAQSGCQIAEELYQSGRKVYLCVGSAPRVPRRYRGRDGFEWLRLTGFMDRTPEMLPSPAARFAGNPHLSGKDGGHSLNLHRFCREGVILLGHLKGVQDGSLVLAPNMKENLAKADQFETDMLKKVDEYIAQNGIAAPEEALPVLTDGYSAPELETLDLAASGISAIIWAGGYRFDYSLVKLPVTDEFGFPVTRRGVTQYPGLYFLGMPWLYKMKSGLLIGVGEDAEYLAERIAAS